MAKDRKNPKYSEKDNEKDVSKKSKKLDNAFADVIKDSLISFHQIPEEERKNTYGDKEFLDQFWEYFSAVEKNVIETIDKKDLPIYFEMIEKKWFSLQVLKDGKQAHQLHEIFKPENSATERGTMEESLKKLQLFCKKPINKIPDSVFKDFANATWFDPDSCILDPDGELKTIDDLWIQWKQFSESETVPVGGENIKLKDHHKESFQTILNPNYNPTERVMIQVACQKIKKLLPKNLHTDFDLRFESSINAFSAIQTLTAFQTEWIDFLRDHAWVIDESLAKKLDKVIVTNGDIHQELLRSGRKFDGSKWFSGWEIYFRTIFNKLATRQLFQEVRETEDLITSHVNNIADTFKKFPPYVNYLFQKYPYSDAQISAVNPWFSAKISTLDKKLSDIQETIATTQSTTERADLKSQMRKILEEKNTIRWEAYVAYLHTQNPTIAAVVQKLVDAKFDFRVLSVQEQQSLVDLLVKEKLRDLIKNKIPELLSVDEKQLTTFVDELFDLQKVDGTYQELHIPTRYGPIPITFKDKGFIGEGMKKLLSIEELDKTNLQNLPLNFSVDVVAWSEAEKFFEEGAMFASLFSPFNAANGKQKLNESYKVQIKKWGKTAEWYLSQYPPFESFNQEKKKGEEWDEGNRYLYSQPINYPNQEREIVTWDNQPVVVKAGEEEQYDVNILEKNLNLNGEAIGALLFGFVLGQESKRIQLSDEKKEELAKKMWTLDTYKDINELYPEEEQKDEKKKPEEKKEDSEYTSFLKEREDLGWYKFPDAPGVDPKDSDKWFRVGSSLMIRLWDTALPPLQTWWGQWIKAEIIEIKDKKSFTLKFTGGELSMWSFEWAKKELPINDTSLASLKEAFGKEIYKIPLMKKNEGPNECLDYLKQSWFDGDKLNATFGQVTWKNNKFEFSLGDYTWQEVKYFWWHENKVGEAVDKETEGGGQLATTMLYKIKYNSNGTIKVSTDTKFELDGKPFPYEQDMDYANFLLFVSGKQLQPKSEEQAQAIQQNKQDSHPDTGAKDKGKFFSIGNFVSFITNIPKKIGDGIKKYDEEKTEDLTDMLVNQWELYTRIGWMLPFSRISAGFKNVWMEYYTDRDNRIWKKIEKWKNSYETDPHFATMCNNELVPLLRGRKKVDNHYQLAWVLLAMIAKGKWPYNRNTDLVGTWAWIKLLLGAWHQSRYLAIKEKKMRELQQNRAIYGQAWADQILDEIVKLEMKYIVHVLDGRELMVTDKSVSWEEYLAGKWSRKFANSLDEASSNFFKQSTVEESYSKASVSNFEYARFEYFRLISDRPQQALSMLKIMAEKAITTRDWQMFEVGVLAGMLSGVFLNMTETATKSFIQKICRTRGFLPWILVRQPDHQAKIMRLLNIVTQWKNWSFTKDTWYDLKNFQMGNMVWIKDAKGAGTKRFINSNPGWWQLLEWWESSNKDDGTKRSNGNIVSNFFHFTWQNAGGKNIFDLYADKDTPFEDKILLKELMGKSMENDEEIDSNVKMNTYCMDGSVFTKSQSVVEEFIRFQDWEFKGKTKDDKQGMQSFWENVATQLPQLTQASSSEAMIKYMIQKFFNRFPWFESNQRTEFIRRLTAVQKKLHTTGLSEKQKKENTDEAEDILRYSIVWTIARKSGRDNIPPQLQKWLEAFKDFFKNNLDTILRPDVVEETFWYQHVGDLQKPYKFDSWKDYVEVSDPTLLYGLPQEERQKRNKRKAKYGWDKYGHTSLYKLAEDLERNWYGETNRFKKYHDQEVSSSDSKEELHWALSPGWVKIKNPGVAKKIKDILSGRNPENEDQDEDEYIDDIYGNSYR